MEVFINGTLRLPPHSTYTLFAVFTGTWYNTDAASRDVPWREYGYQSLIPKKNTSILIYISPWIYPVIQISTIPWTHLTSPCGSRTTIGPFSNATCRELCSVSVTFVFGNSIYIACSLLVTFFPIRLSLISAVRWQYGLFFFKDTNVLRVMQIWLWQNWTSPKCYYWKITKAPDVWYPPVEKKNCWDYIGCLAIHTYAFWSSFDHWRFSAVCCHASLLWQGWVVPPPPFLSQCHPPGRHWIVQQSFLELGFILFCTPGMNMYLCIEMPR